MAQSESEHPLLVSPYGNANQAVIATLPLLGMFLYFLYEAAVRPRKPLYALGDVDDEYAIQDAIDQTPALIPLIDMIPVFLTFQALFTLLFVWTMVFIPRRRKLLQSYVEKGESCLGDVAYDGDKKRWWCSRRVPQYGELIYAYPNTTEWTIRKRIRLYQHYSRERITVLRLLNRPFSGQPKTDVQIDLMSSKAAIPQVKVLSNLALAWIVFTFLSPLFVIYQMTKLYNDDYEDVSYAIKFYLIVGVAGIPIVVVSFVFLRWAFYRHWVVNRGWIIQNEDEEDNEGMGAQDEGVVGVFLTELVGKDHPEELSTVDEDASIGTFSFSMNNFSRRGGSLAPKGGSIATA